MYPILVAKVQANDKRPVKVHLGITQEIISTFLPPLIGQISF